MSRPASYANGFAPRDGMPLYPSLWSGCLGAWSPCLGPTGQFLRDHGRKKNIATRSAASPDLVADWYQSEGLYSYKSTGTNPYWEAAPAANDPLASCGAGEFAIAMWLTYDGTGAYTSLLGNMVTWNPGILLGTVGGNALGWYLGDTTERNTTIPLTPYNTWLHLVVQRSGGTVSHYLNGAAAGTSFANSNSIAGTQGLWIGRCNAFSRYWTGLLDDIRIYDRALNANEMRLLATRRGIAYQLSSSRPPSKSGTINRRRRSLLRVT